MCAITLLRQTSWNLVGHEFFDLFDGQFRHAKTGDFAV